MIPTISMGAIGPTEAPVIASSTATETSNAAVTAPSGSPKIGVKGRLHASRALGMSQHLTAVRSSSERRLTSLAAADCLIRTSDDTAASGTSTIQSQVAPYGRTPMPGLGVAA